MMEFSDSYTDARILIVDDKCANVALLAKMLKKPATGTWKPPPSPAMSRPCTKPPVTT